MTEDRLVGAVEFYSQLAEGYDRDFDVLHRKAYDDLAWQAVEELLPDRPGTIVDVGCGTGRWAERLVAAGHRVVGIEPAPAMADEAARRGLGDAFVLVGADVDDAGLAAGGRHHGLLPDGADIVLAMGSVQYAPDPSTSIRTMASWLRPGGGLAMLCDSLCGLVLELLGRGDPAQAVERALSRTGRWTRGGLIVEHHLLDAGSLRRAYEDAGLTAVEVRGLLVAAAAVGHARFYSELDEEWEATLDRERTLSRVEALAESGKQLLAIGRRPAWS